MLLFSFVCVCVSSSLCVCVCGRCEPNLYCVMSKIHEARSTFQLRVHFFFMDGHIGHRIGCDIEMMFTCDEMYSQIAHSFCQRNGPNVLSYRSCRSCVESFFSSLFCVLLTNVHTATLHMEKFNVPVSAMATQSHPIPNTMDYDMQ